MPTKIRAGDAMPSFSLPKVGGGQVKVGDNHGGWQVVVVYRGRHCPICKRYLATLEGLKQGYAAAKADVVAISADPKEKAEADVREFGWSFPVGYGLTPEQMRKLGLYISSPRSPQETDRPFAEPGLFIVNPAGQIQIVDVSNAPFARPDLEAVLNGLKFVQEKGYPIRGTAA
jgi:peroxiredoxin